MSHIASNVEWNRHIMPSNTSTSSTSSWQALLLLFLLPRTATAQSALHIQLASDCTICITVDSSQGEFATLQTSDCSAASNRDKLWLLAQDAADGGGWWCLDADPTLCVEEGGTLLLSTESETSPYQQFAYEDELRGAGGSQIVGGGSDACVTLVTGGGVLMNDCAVGGGEGIGATRQRWRAVEEGRPLCPDGGTDGGGDGFGGGNGGSTGSGGGGFIGDETTLPDPSRILMFLENGCNQCIGVDDAEADAPLKLVSCKDTPNMLKLWSLDLLVGSSIAQSVCLEFDPSLCIVETDEGGLRLGDGGGKSAYIMNKFIDDQIESLEEVGSCIAFVGGDAIALEECSTSKSGQYFTKQGEAYWMEECANTPPPSPRPTAKPTSGPAPPSRMSEEVPWWTILLVVIGSILVGVAVYYLASAYFSSQRRRSRSSRSGRSQQSPGIS